MSFKARFENSHGGRHFDMEQQNKAILTEKVQALFWKNLKTLKMRWDGIKGGTRWKEQKEGIAARHCTVARQFPSRAPRVSPFGPPLCLFLSLSRLTGDQRLCITRDYDADAKGSQRSHPALKKVLLCVDTVSQHQAALEWTVWCCLQSAGHGWWCTMGPFITRDQITEAQSLWSSVWSGGKKRWCAVAEGCNSIDFSTAQRHTPYVDIN